jgi:hypothetical protein
MINIKERLTKERNYIDDIKNIALTPNQYFIARGQYIIYEFTIKTTSRNLPSSGILGFKKEDSLSDIGIEEKVIDLIPNASYTVLEIRTKPENLIYQEYKYQTGNIKIIISYIYILYIYLYIFINLLFFLVNRFISNIGGFYSAVSGVFFILFGASKLSPW